ncbi:MAG: HlyD family type I secretion periplasmic adaptor subunit, partial [Sedimenticolaceae bacterium]
LWLILAFFVSAVVWATLSEIDIVAVAQGRIVPSGHTKTVQPLEIGTVTAIRVAEGQRVASGDVLLELDPRSAQADVERLRQERDSARREVACFRQLADWVQLEEPPDLEERQAQRDALLIHRWREFQDRLGVLERERERQLAERRIAQEQVNKLNAILPIVSGRAADQQGLARDKLLPEQQYLEAEQRRLETVYDLRVLQGRVAELDAAIHELDARVGFSRSEFHRQVLERLEAAERQQSTAEQELAKASTRASARTLTAPIDGVVQQLAVHTVGAVVTPAQELMVIVPQDGALEVEAVLENKDIGFVRIGQTAEIKIDTFPFTKYGTIAGRIVDLSRDAVADAQRGLVYKMRVLMQRSRIEIDHRPVPLSPGMKVTVEAKTGTRRLIEFFLSPLLRYASESVRER